ncbi:hypothetical protein [Methanobacterium oryzae]|uniref:hypothetical protein n=1 Tax=Methanobacterium oryzae TaxID=69540 RepID=UPI003D21C058
MINLKAAIVGFASILFLLWLLYAKIRNNLNIKKQHKIRREKSKNKKLKGKN